MVAAIIMLASTACGSTVAVRGSGELAGAGSQGANSSSNGLGSPAGGSLPGGAGAASGSSAVGGAGVGGAASGGGTGSSPPVVTAGGPAGAAGSNFAGGAGGTRPSGKLVPSIFKVGIQYSSNGASAAAAIGVKYNADHRAESDAVIAWLNKHGGIAGRPAAAAYNDIDATASPQVESQAACSQWTEDDHVTAAIPSSAVTDVDLIRECLKHAQVPAMYGGPFSHTLRSSFESSPLWFENGTLSLEDYAQTYVRGLAKQGFFSGGKVGVVYYDRAPFTTALKSTLLPALRSVGVDAPETFGASIDGATTLESGSREMSSAVLAFRSKGVTKVLFFEPWVGYFVFLNNAKSQQYSPQYGFSSQEFLQLAFDLGAVPADQVNNARFVGWAPLTDVRGFQKYLGPRVALCTQIFKEAGVAPASDQSGYAAQIATCENLLVLRDAYLNAPPTLRPEDFSRGIELLGKGVGLASRVRGEFSSKNRTGTSIYWAGGFDVARNVYAYSGSALPIL